MWDAGDTDGGGANSVSFFDANGNRIVVILYRQGCVCVSSKMNGRYYVYVPVECDINFSTLEEAVKLNGYFYRYW